MVKMKVSRWKPLSLGTWQGFSVSVCECVRSDLQLKDTALPPSPMPLSVVPLELTAWMVNRLFLLLRHALLLAGCSLAGGLGEHASSCLSSSFSSSVVSQGCCVCTADGSKLVSVALLESKEFTLSV